MSDLLTWPQQLSTAGTVGVNRFELGFEPYFRLVVDGKKIINLRAQQAHGYTISVGKPSYESSVWRAEVNAGVGMIPTLAVDLVGLESAKLIREHFLRRAPVEFYAGYADVEGPYRERLLFKGEVVKAKPHPSFPIRATVMIQGLSGRMQQPYHNAVPEYIADSTVFIETCLGRRGLKTNFVSEPTNVSVDNQQSDTLAEPSAYLLDYINAFAAAHALYWTDVGDGEVRFHFPQDRLQYLGQPFMNWELRQRGLVSEPDIAAPLTQWDIESLYAETPAKVEFKWVKPNGRVEDMKLVTETIPGGNPDLPGLVIPIKAKTEEQVRRLAKQYVDDVLWQTVRGPFSVGSIGMPIMPFDYIKATKGPPALDDIYDRDMIVMSVKHIFDSRAWSTSGNVRGIYQG